ncbi:MAG TPA: lytic transglycosylase domain-containing protein [Nevskiales bacterium]|nr:lytic transglycosylase domain-containing protein [Nevskiales bacterium]
MRGGWTLGLALAVLLPLPAPAQTGEIHIYRGANGVPLYTDRKITPRITEDVYAYIGKYGRPTAVLSCQGLTEAGLQARGAQYQHLIDRHARSYGVDPALVKAMMRVESCFDANAVSKVGAQGLMQLMPYTAQKLGVRNSFDPDENIRGGVQYLSGLLKRFNNNLEHAIAAYNAGPLNVEKYRGVPPFTETQSYLKRVLAHYRRYAP